jgi:ubiquinone/menaquinone biosynthesis C-methylase UbiE
MNEEKIKKIFDDSSDNYDKFHSKNFYNAVLGFLLENISKNSRVLDVGCGTGIFTDVLFKSGYYARGFDFSEKMIEKAKEKHDQMFRVGNAEEKVPFDEKFDCAIAIDSWEYFQSPQKVLYNVNKALEKNGTFIIITPNVYLAPIAILAEKLKIKKLKPEYAFFNSFKHKIEKHCKNTGFEITKREWTYYYFVQIFLIRKTRAIKLK